MILDINLPLKTQKSEHFQYNFIIFIFFTFSVSIFLLKWIKGKFFLKWIKLFISFIILQPPNGPEQPKSKPNKNTNPEKSGNTFQDWRDIFDWQFCVQSNPQMDWRTALYMKLVIFTLSEDCYEPFEIKTQKYIPSLLLHFFFLGKKKTTVSDWISQDM